MSTRDIAYSIFEQLTEEQLKGFIALFSGIYPTSVSNDSQERRDEAFRRFESIRMSIPDFDEKKALAEYREERTAKKKAAITVLEGLKLDLPENFDADKELADALEKKYGTAD